MQHVVDSPIAETDSRPRRSFMVRAAAVVFGGIVAVFPFAAGLGVLFDPLRRRTTRRGDAAAAGDGKFVRIGPLDLVPADGIPRQFALTADVADAWTRTAAQRIGSAFLNPTHSSPPPQN